MEIELKFQVPQASLAALRRALTTKTAQQIELQARYVDTPDGRLAAARIALRLRREGAQWVQTLKAAGPNLLARLEHEVLVDTPDSEPRIDITRHAGTPVGEAVAKALGTAGATALQTVFETRIHRTLRTVRHEGAAIEVALDIGVIVAGTQEVPVCELELELKRGAPSALLSLAARWVARHQLWLDVRSKAERGLQLAGRGEAALRGSLRPAGIDATMACEPALRALVAACLTPMLPAAARVADGGGAAEPVHQLRVGLRRLRTVLRLFGHWSTATEPAWEPALRTLFGHLGTTRDRDVLSASVTPLLQAAGAPLAKLPPATQAGDAAEAMRTVATTHLLLALLNFAHGSAAPTDAPQPVPLRSAARAVMRKLRRGLVQDADNFATQDDTLRHRTRRRLKRWRYALEFMAPMYAPKRVKRCLVSVRAAQELLGRYNDLAVAEQAFRAHAAQDGRAWFAVGWLNAQRAQLVEPAHAALQNAAEAARRLRLTER